MSEDEIFVFIGASVIAFWAWMRWTSDIMMIYDRRGRYAGVVAVSAPFLSFTMLFLILKNFASFDVKDSAVYLTFYMVLGFAWCGMMTKIFSFLGLDFRHDVAEQDNYAADVAIGGAVLGSMFCFSGGNIGDGPGWWVVIFCAMISSGAFMIIWVVLDQMNGVCEAITVDRDLASGVRFSGLLVSAGMVLGRAVAGDWVSCGMALADFLRISLPAVLILVLAAAVIDRWARPSREVPRPNVFMAGVLPALIYIFLAGYYVLNLGAW